MDINLWKEILFDWIKGTDLIDFVGSLEHINLDDFFILFYHKIHPISIDHAEKIDIKEFFSETYPDYEILYDETNNISSQDFVYIFSLLLHYSCVRENNKYFQKACTKLQSKFQLSVADFLGFIDQHSSFTKEIIRTGIKKATNTMSPLQTKYFALNSPLRTPKKSDISPTTPSKDFINTKLKELNVVRTQLENEKFERNMLESEVKESQDKIENLTRKCRDLNHEIQLLKSTASTDSTLQNTSPNKAQRDSQIRRKMQKEIQHRDDVITDLKYELENANAINKKYLDKISAMEKQINEMRLKILELDASVDELLCNISAMEQEIDKLRKEKQEIEEYLEKSECKDISPKNSDFSGCSSLYTTSCDFEENLAKGFVDLQLKEKENEVRELNEQLSSAIKINQELEVKIMELTSTMKNLEIELNETKASKVKLFDEKSKEIQLIQNQLNSTTQENLKYQREIESKQKLNLKMLEENDEHKVQLENFNMEINALKDQKSKRDVEFVETENQLKISKENENMLKQQLSIISATLEEFSLNTISFEESTKKTFQDMEENIKIKTDKIEELTNRLDQLKKDFESQLKDSDDKLAVKTNQYEMLNIKILELESKQLREQIFNDEVNKNNEILRAKLTKAREELTEFKKQSELEKEAMSADCKKKIHGEMVKKLDGYKSEMAAKYNKILAENKQKDEKLASLENQNNNLKKQLEEKDGIVKNFDLLITKFQNEQVSLKEEMEEKDKRIKSLILDIKQEKRDKEFLNSKLQFLEKSDDNSFKVSQTVSSEFGENFDNQFLSDLKSGSGFDDASSLCSASLFQQRNSQYPLHLRDSYIIRGKDQDLSEHDMRFGTVKITDALPSSPTNEMLRKRKQGTNYQRPGLRTPSKNGRLSISSNSNVLKDTTNTENVENKSTPLNFIKSIAAHFSKPKDELFGKNIRSLTPKRLRNQKDSKWIIEKDTTDSDENIKCSRKVKELDRKEKRLKARDMNRPNLNDDCTSTGSSTVCSSDTDWIEEECIEEEDERHSNTSTQHDKSLEYIKTREVFRKRQQKMRRRSFTKNRCSILKNHKIPVTLSRLSSDDFDKFKSCTSLRSESSLTLNNISQTPKKSYTRNFINTHLAEYERISDYYVNSRHKILQNNADKFWSFNFKDISKPFPLIVIIMLTIFLIAVLLHNFNNHK